MVRINIAMEGVPTQNGMSIVIAPGAIKTPEEHIGVSKMYVDPIGWCSGFRRGQDGTLSMEFTSHYIDETIDWSIYVPAVVIRNGMWDDAQTDIRVLVSGELGAIVLESREYLPWAGVHPLSPGPSESMNRSVAWPDMPTLVVER